jgi:hypothetical protein
MGMEKVSKGRLYVGAAIIWLSLHSLRLGFWVIGEPMQTVDVDGEQAYPIDW